MENHSGLASQEKEGKGFFSRLFSNLIIRIGLGILLLAILGGVGYGLYLTQLSPPQPLQFPHVKMVSIGVPCLYCHPGALTGPSPGLPTVAKCNACHQQVAKTNPDVEKFNVYVKNNEPIPWVPVFILPDFVYYSHRPHIAAGLNCENCHGEIGQETVTQPQKMNMGWCLSCHRTRFKDDPVMLTKLTDCVTCHR